MNPVFNFINQQGWPQPLVSFAIAGTSLAAIFIAAGVILWISRSLLTPLTEKAIIRSTFKWDDILIKHGFFRSLSTLVPIVVVYFGSDLFFKEQLVLAEVLRRGSMTLLVIFSVKTIDRLLLASKELLSSKASSKALPIAGYIGVIKIVLYIFSGIFIVGVLMDKSPWGILSVFGGLTAVLILVFKDTILGFVASLQLSGNKMIQVGDWIEMPQFNADGDVIDVSIHTVKVQNWDKTITTIPTYALVTNAFKNWRGMSESGGRRIKRSIHIDMNSVNFCTDMMLEKFKKFSLLTDYITAKQEEIAEHNAKLGVESAAGIPNGRSQTNIGVFRAYIKAYLRNHPKIHDNMTFLVRHLAPTAKGLPLEIYVFSNDQVWANYEGIQADIFDHILAVVPEFGLRVFQEPSGADIHLLKTPARS